MAEKKAQNQTMPRALPKENSIPIRAPNISSSTSVKLRKSSNIFSTLVRKARRKKTGNKNSQDGVKNLLMSSQNESGSSTLSAHIEEEVEMNCQNFEKKCSQNQEIFWEGRAICSETNTSNHSGSSNRTQRNIINLRTTQSYSGFKAANFQKVQNESKQISEEKPTEDDYFIETSPEDTVITSYQSFVKTPLDITHAEALQYLQEVINSFHESENHIMQLLAKYISDPITQQEMKTAICNHSKLQWEAERRSASLANDIWIQQLEIGRAQENIIQGTLQSLVNQNRQLQIENESIYRKYEKSKKCSDQKNRFQECDSQVDAVLRHNEKLEAKLKSSFKKIESLEGELITIQKQNSSMEDQLRESAGKIRNMKALLHGMKTDHNIEQVALNFKLETQERLLQAAFDLGSLALDDIDHLKAQIDNFPFDFKWPQLTVRNDSLTDLIHLCRSCIHELSNELFNLYSEAALKDKDIATLRETNANLQQTTKIYLAELETMAKEVEESKSLKNEKYLLEQKSHMLESSLKLSTEKVDQFQTEYEAEKTQLLKSLKDQEKYIEELEAKDKMIEETKVFLSNITTENVSLQNEIATLNRIIKESGAGDVVKEIEHKHEEIQYFKMELERVRNENIQLKSHSDTTQHANAVLASNQELAQKALQRQINDLEKLNEDNQNLKQTLENKHQTVISLKNERVKYLEEKGVLKSIIQRLKNELSKINQLEDNLTTVSREASKISLIANYNKQQSNKFKQEIIERDNIIIQMQTSLQKLHEIQLENSKEKLTLCHQLNEASQLKQRLSNVLESEVKKNAELGQSKEAIVKSVSSQFQRIEDKHRNERTAIRILLRDIKTVTQDKETAIQQQQQLQVQQLKAKLSEQEEAFQIASKELSIKNGEIKELRSEMDRYEKLHKDSNEKFENEASKYELNVKQLKKLIEQLRSDKKDLEKSIEYLKNNVEKLYKDLNESRQSEKTTLDALRKAREEDEHTKELLNGKILESTKIILEKDKLSEEKSKLLNENDTLTKETEYLNAMMDNVVNDFEKSLRTAEDKEKLFKEELKESQQIIHHHSIEIVELKQSVELKTERIEELEDLLKMEHIQENRFNRLKEEMEQLEKDSEELREVKTNLEKQLFELQDDHSQMKNHITSLENESDVLESQLKIVLDQKEEDYVFYKKHIAEISKTRDELEEQSKKEISMLRMELQDLNNRLVNEKTAYETLSQIHKDISGKFMRSIKDLVEAKNSKCDMQDKMHKNQKYLDNVENDQKQFLKQIKDLTEKLEFSQTHTKKIEDEKRILESNYNMTIEQCRRLEEQVNDIKKDHQTEHIQYNSDKHKEDNTSQEEMEEMKSEIERKIATIHRLKMEVLELQKEITLLQLQKSEIMLQLHETEIRLETEKNLGDQLKNTQKLLLVAVLQLKDEGKIDSSDCIHLLHMVSSSSPINLDMKTEN
ncbi:golgin subfamily A member 4-like isoform X2 [Dendroctonus ponderosae]|uniref:golgin subfamily A member 4-like isoform X2 n=1 Tax=Dendroctonus ponderosae TaxID=77166 RepID=UPI0020351DC9|nr:golgin subfamily A member 4-like isoform X2 [Dendroctonus ponderosae]XP_048522052.1 golgin subfamily A member 4-like isoform X2 [Dendroctonus ponderosae]